MNFELQLKSEPAELISVNKFQAALMKKKIKKNELQQISEFNRKSSKSSETTQTGELISSQFDLKIWGEELSNKKEIDFFAEEGKELLGAQRSVKYLNLKLVFLSFVMHLLISWRELSQNAGLQFFVHNVPLVLLSILIFYDVRYKLPEQNRTKIYLAYKYSLIVSMSLSLLNLLMTLRDIWSTEHFQVQYWFFLFLYGSLIAAEIKLYMLNSYLLFITKELSKKYQADEEEMSDNI